MKWRHKQKPLVESKNPNWKGGISKDKYHYKKIQINRYPERVRARQILKNAIDRGKIPRPNKCSKCGKVCKPYGHHIDYSKPLDVLWVCRACHKELDKQRPIKSPPV